MALGEGVIYENNVVKEIRGVAERKKKKKKKDYGSVVYLQSYKGRLYSVDGGLPGSFGILSWLENGSSYEGAVPVLRLLDAVDGENQRDTVNGRIVVPRQ